MPEERAAATRAQRDFKRDLKVNIPAYKNDWDFFIFFPTRKGGVRDTGSQGRQGQRWWGARYGENVSPALLGRKGQDTIDGDVRFQQHLKGKEIHMVWTRIKIAWKSSSRGERGDSESARARWGARWKMPERASGALLYGVTRGSAAGWKSKNRLELLRNEEAGARQALDWHAKEQDLCWHF